MASRGKPEELLDNELDRISELPDPLICQILYHISTRAAVSTSVLSTRWRTLWLWVPSLDLNYRDDLDGLVNFGDRFFHSDRVSCIDKVELYVPSYKKHEGVDDLSYVTSWIDAAVKRKIQHLAVVNFTDSSNHDGWIKCYLHQMPLSLYMCETLVSLKLLEVILPDSEFISLHCLKILHLTILWNPSEATFERLVSSSPVLEELDICGFRNDSVQVFRVISRSLKKLTINTLFTGSEVVIDAPRLGFLSIDSSLSESYMITNMDSTNIQLDIHLGCNFGDFDETRSLLSNRNSFCSFLSGISKVRDITILGNSFKGYSWCKWLPTILGSCPNLKSLSLECCYAEHPPAVLHLEDEEEIKFSHVPECLLSSLEFVDLHVPLTRVVGEMLVRYIIDNSAILKKLTLSCLRSDCSATRDDLVKKLLKIPRGSTKCEVVVFDWNREQVRYCDDFV